MGIYGTDVMGLSSWDVSAVRRPFLPVPFAAVWLIELVYGTDVMGLITCRTDLWDGNAHIQVRARFGQATATNSGPAIWPTRCSRIGAARRWSVTDRPEQ